ncbi:DUF427 domain-containing protein [Arthrobacter sp. ISL-30]|uniref:DUF427 domain-containing protein n=1 Tax=Arthrobacter sp. ISL-30 TaxID=2819109 RepID=UPI001BE816EF|nr:DUF427 domain-containing protein [Arthrobacter sp. ISL-30]MBT2515661.1 DUF427 domain-containing protein [Arthrobacter sp. ISL-30]
MKAIWNGAIVAESDDTVVVEGNHYFPRESIRSEFLQPSDEHTFCGWKGVASYYTLLVDGRENRNAAWYYAEPIPGAEAVKNRIAFWHGVTLQE